MRNRIGMFILLQAMFTYAYADNVQQGAATYDWQTCVSSKTGDCMNGCAMSNNIHCQANCKQDAKDKCQSEGLNPS